jgi:PAS domain S-box-containing protein
MSATVVPTGFHSTIVVNEWTADAADGHRTLSLVWLVDDSDLEREIARRALSKHHEVVEFENGDKVLERLRQKDERAPDVLVLDYHLPSLSGIDITRHVRRTLSPSELPVLILSSTFTASEDVVEGLAAGANDYVLKPFSAIELQARVSALAAAKEQRQRAEIAERSLRKILQHLPDAFFAIDLEGRISFVNREAERVLRRDWSELLSQPLAAIVPELGDLHARSAALPAHVQIGERRYEPAIGRLVIEEEVGETVTLTLRDVTDKLLAIDRRDRFLAMLGHELRNPLAPILSAAQLQRAQPGDPQLIERTSGVILRQVERLIRIVDDLLDVSRVSRGRIEVRPEAVDVATAVERALESSHHLIKLHQHEVDWTPPQPPLAVKADPVRFEQMLTNLLTNAAKYTPDRGAIHVAARADGEFIEVAVRDDGMGIPPGSLESIFDLFVQIEDSLSRSEGGLGIGLPLVRSLATLHGGTVTAHSGGIGKGAEFVLRLPASATKPAVKETKVAGKTPVRRVLLVDDNVDVIELIGAMLTRRGHVVKLLHDGLEAVAHGAGFTPDVALVDIGLPGCDGYEVARQLRPQLPQTLLVAVTGYGRPEDAQRAHEAGFDRHIVKPITFDAVEQLLDESTRRPPSP